MLARALGGLVRGRRRTTSRERGSVTTSRAQQDNHHHRSRWVEGDTANILCRIELSYRLNTINYCSLNSLLSCAIISMIIRLSSAAHWNELLHLWVQYFPHEFWVGKVQRHTRNLAAQQQNSGRGTLTWHQAPLICSETP
jgi:hypothetical protein